MTYALESPMYSLLEKRTEPYFNTVREYSQRKNAPGTKSTSRVLGSAEKSAGEVRRSWA